MLKFKHAGTTDNILFLPSPCSVLNSFAYFFLVYCVLSFQHFISISKCIFIFFGDNFKFCKNFDKVHLTNSFINHQD